MRSASFQAPPSGFLGADLAPEDAYGLLLFSPQRVALLAKDPLLCALPLLRSPPYTRPPLLYSWEVVLGLWDEVLGVFQIS